MNVRNKITTLSSLKTNKLAAKKVAISTNKTTFLQQTSERIEQKLSFLKQKIILQKSKNHPKVNQVAVKENQMEQFLLKIGMHSHYKKLVQNNVDSFDILKEIKVIQLEEIGIPKGHALKIYTNLEKCLEKKIIGQRNHVNKNKQDKQGQVKSNNKIEIQDIQNHYNAQTEDLIVQKKKSKIYFCLFCYNRSQESFCSQKCQIAYTKMFHEYEQNLKKAQQQFPDIEQKQKQQMKFEPKQIINDFNVQDKSLDNINLVEYENIKDLLQK